MSSGVQLQGQQSSGPAPAQAPAQNSFVDTFVTSADPNWGPNDAYSQVFGGRFQFDVPKRQRAERYTTAYSGTKVDLQVQFAVGPGTSAGAAVGLIFWADRKHDAKTLFLIDAVGGPFGVFSESSGRRTPIADWMPVRSIHARIGVHNIIEVMASAKHTCACRKLDSPIEMMQATDHGLRNDPAKSLDRAADRCVLS